MSPREQLQGAYELAFQPARLHAAWNDWEKHRTPDPSSLQPMLDWAVTLHQRLPEAPGVAGRALRRLARYQAASRLYRLPTMLRRFRQRLGATEPIPDEIPPWMVRDIAVAVLSRSRSSQSLAPACLRVDG